MRKNKPFFGPLCVNNNWILTEAKVERFSSCNSLNLLQNAELCCSTFLLYFFWDFSLLRNAFLSLWLLIHCMC